MSVYSLHLALSKRGKDKEMLMLLGHFIKMPNGGKINNL
jgi:hypothetical protein